tara:strand:- start:20 stop:280 length:261 start_codon:yes stop_codon:yes gene_type:complete
MKYSLYVIILILVVSCTTPNIPQSKQLPKKDWVKIYKHEIRVALQNEDMWAYYFFAEELRNEIKRVNQLNDTSYEYSSTPSSNRTY